ncbi:hypothetical protein SEA_SLEEPYHEAD_63 [Rhodococcus phage Sleepyhead]|uniref:Uncharacterized protein n=1 Tax=Rhodococcus phage Sleepyhead TaxID=2591131 RepID=A0A515MHC9_9CAUD|nr:hypothetical protein HWC38_gp63 [Rhodococcus phage Sleepyhead]QDM56078.1 hypothetical protein SEA_SLEEPYHEAD_63 [Rhodococcus phage Sleepyhead]
MSDRIIDEIDALVDEQLSGYSERSGYDYNVNQQKCWHCGEDWHGLKITARMREMRDAFLYGCGCDLCQANGGVASDYRYSSDDSEVLCPGSDFIGPWATKRQIERMRSVELGYLDGGWIQPQGDPLTVRLQAMYSYAFPQRYVLGAGLPGENIESRPYVQWRDPGDLGIESTSLEQSRTPQDPRSLRLRPFDQILARAIDRTVARQEGVFEIADGEPYLFGRDFDWGDSVVPTQDLVNDAFDRLRELGLLPEPMTLSRWLVGDPEPDTRTPQERALPRPSTTPPMWAVDAGRQRRARTNSRRRHR